jgi:nifR3 family TIM-barrel protein
MVSAEGIVRNNVKTLELLRRADNETLFAVQIFASEPQSAATAVRMLGVHHPDLFDLNCGCSVPKVLKSGSGAALLREPERIGAILRAMGKETDRPITVKLRSGWDQNSINFLRTAEAAEREGAAMLCLHPRTGKQGFSGRAQMSHLKTLKSYSGIPVIGSGDLFTPEDARNMFQASGCDGVMFARGALGNPFIFRATSELLGGKRSSPPPTPGERLETALQQLRLTVTFKGELRACKDMRKHFCHYSKGMPGAAELRSRAVRAESVEDYQNLVEKVFGPNGFK